MMYVGYTQAWSRSKQIVYSFEILIKQQQNKTCKICEF